jgi:CBS domain-containing protein
MVMKRTAKHIMTSTVITAKEDMLVTDVMKLLLRWHISGVPVAGISAEYRWWITRGC